MVDLNMSLEKDISIAVQSMFKHAKSQISLNLTNAVLKGQITIDKDKLPGLEMIIHRSIDDSFRRSSREIAAALKKHDKK